MSSKRYIEWAIPSLTFNLYVAQPEILSPSGIRQVNHKVSV